MAHFPHSAHIAIHAANEQRRKIEQEEEEMTKYTSEDLEQDWEFKIVRGFYPVFRKPEVFQTLLEEEALAGWELVEKLDDRRVRFKRRKDARRRDATLPPGIDPYRTQYGTNTNAIGVAIGLISLLLFAGLFLAIALFEKPSFDFGGGTPFVLIATVIPGLMVIIGIVAVILARARRG
jgi:hypothetical protein